MTSTHQLAARVDLPIPLTELERGIYSPAALTGLDAGFYSPAGFTETVPTSGLWRPDPGYLAVTGADITLDESWAPYCQVSLTCNRPNPLTVEALDPRGTNPLRTQLTLTRDGVARTFDLCLRSRRVDGDEITLTAASDEALLQDYARVATTAYTPAYISARTIVADVLAKIGATLAAGTADAVVAAESSEWLPGVTAWDYLEPIVHAAQLRLWCDERRVWRLEQANGMSSGYAELDGEADLTGGGDEITRDGDWFDGVVIVYQYQDAVGQVTSYDIAPADGTPVSKVRTLSFQTAPPAPGAAARLLRGALGRGRERNVQAVSRFDVTPTMPCSVTLPGLPAQAGVLSAVTWTLPADEMTIRTRGLVDVPDRGWVSLPGGLAWNELPAGTSWTEFEGAA